MFLNVVTDTCEIKHWNVQNILKNDFTRDALGLCAKRVSYFFPSISVCLSVYHEQAPIQAQARLAVFTIRKTNVSSSFLSANFVLLIEGIPLKRRELVSCEIVRPILPILTLLAWKRLSIGTHLLLIITSITDELFGGTDGNDLELPWTPK